MLNKEAGSEKTQLLAKKLFRWDFCYNFQVFTDMSVSTNRRRLREQIFTLLGNRCVGPDCGWINEDGTRGCTDIRCLQIDHKNGGGHQAVLKAGNNYEHLKEILRDPEIHEHYQLLCANCNWIKRHLNNEFNRKGTRQSTERQLRIRDMILERPDLTQAAIGEIFGISRVSVYHISKKFGIQPTKQ